MGYANRKKKRLPSQHIITHMIKYYLLLTLLLMTTWGCTDNLPPVPPEQSPKTTIEDVALDSLYARLQRHNKDKVKLSKEKNHIRVGDGALSLKVEIEFEGRDMGQYVYAANFLTTYTSKKSYLLAFGVIGLGANKQEAMTVALEDWSFQFGVAFTNLLVDKGTATTFESWPLYDCPLGIRGEFPGNVGIFGDSTGYTKMIKSVQPFFPKGKDQIISVDIRFGNTEEGLDGTCAINNEVSPAAIEGLKSLDWPKSDSGYIAKFYFLLDMRDIR
jgi:hypothetical protein